MGHPRQERQTMEPYECIELENVDSVLVVKFVDKKVMDPARIERMGQELLALVDEGKVDNLLINFENVKFFSSAAINLLIVLEKRVRGRGGSIRLGSLRPEVRDLFSYTNLDSIFKIEEEQTESVDSSE
jgi:anti-sigma B factor antagonist